METESKVCNKCGLEKSIDKYYRNSRGKYGRAQTCGECSKIYAKEYRENNLPKVYARKYNITEELAEILINHKECEICGETGGRLVIDHCHKSGSVRGRLCSVCNTGLGMFRDDPKLLSVALGYLGEQNYEL
jgi:hypothetical protein